MITQRRLQELFHYDPGTGRFTRLVYRSYRAKVGDVAGTVGGDGYRSMMVDGVTYRCSRLAWIYCHGNAPINQIDHMDGIRTNDRIDNLRDVTKLLNGDNRRKANSNNKLGILGVTTRRSSFRARIRVRGKLINIGTFADSDKAYEAYVQAKRLLHPGCTI